MKENMMMSASENAVEVKNVNIDYTGEQPLISGRELHKALNIKTPYTQWFDRMCEYGFAENTDYLTVHKNVIRADGVEMPQTQYDHTLTLSMAKELCMIQRTDIGRQFRQYFISVEEKWNSPEMIMQRALTIANERVKALQESVSQLTVTNAAMKPKADYFDDCMNIVHTVDRRLLTGIRVTAKELKAGQKEFVDFLLDNGYVYRDIRYDLQPYMQHVQNGLFEVKEYINKMGHTGTQTFVTPKGKETFRLLLKKA